MLIKPNFRYFDSFVLSFLIMINRKTLLCLLTINNISNLPSYNTVNILSWLHHTGTLWLKVLEYCCLSLGHVTTLILATGCQQSILYHEYKVKGASLFTGLSPLRQNLSGDYPPPWTSDCMYLSNLSVENLT